MAYKSTSKNPMHMYVVSEGDVHLITDAPLRDCRPDNWMCDWMIVEAEDTIAALLVASATDNAANKQIGRISQKVKQLLFYRTKLDPNMTPLQILEKHSNAAMRQSFVSINKK